MKKVPALQRLEEIDFIRGVGMLGMIWSHACAYFLGSSVAFFFWDLGLFSVHAFIFCSAYLFFLKEQAAHISVSYFWKRAKRLLIPYYLFLIILFSLWFIIEPAKLQPSYILGNIFLTDGESMNWLVVLFLELTLVLPLLQFLKNRMRPLFWGYVLLSILASIYLNFFSYHLPFRITMWFTWSLVPVFTLYYMQFGKKKWFFPVTIILLAVFHVATYYQHVWAHTSLVQFNNKYPPNIYHIAWGLMWVSILLFLYAKAAFIFRPIRPLYMFLSRYSYTIYFIHFLVLTILAKKTPYLKFHAWGFFLLILVISIAIQYILNRAVLLLKGYRQSR